MSRSKGARTSRVSQIQMENGQLSEELERRYLDIIRKNLVPNVNEQEAEALTRMAGQYMVYKRHLGESIEELTEAFEENEVSGYVLNLNFRIL